MVFLQRYFRDTNEMPHVLEERLRLSTKYAVRYTEQFSAGFIEGIAKAIAFILGNFYYELKFLKNFNSPLAC